MPRFIITYRNKKGEIFSQKVYAKNQTHAILKTRLEYYEILSITKLNKKLGERL